MFEIAGDDRHASRCLKLAEIDWDASIKAAKQFENRTW